MYWNTVVTSYNRTLCCIKRNLQQYNFTWSQTQQSNDEMCADWQYFKRQTIALVQALDIYLHATPEILR